MAFLFQSWSCIPPTHQRSNPIKRFYDKKTREHDQNKTKIIDQTRHKQNYKKTIVPPRKKPKKDSADPRSVVGGFSGEQKAGWGIRCPAVDTLSGAQGGQRRADRDGCVEAGREKQWQERERERCNETEWGRWKKLQAWPGSNLYIIYHVFVTCFSRVYGLIHAAINLIQFIMTDFHKCD